MSVFAVPKSIDKSVEKVPLIFLNISLIFSALIDDDSFIQGIQFLVKEKIIEIKASLSPRDQIPSWVKNNAGWWAELVKFLNLIF